MKMRSMIAGLVALLACAGTAHAQSLTCNTNLVQLSNGTTADATQVMQNFNNLLGCLTKLQGYIGGLTLANDATTPATVIDTASGIAESDDVTTLMTLPTFTKNANAVWTVGSGNGCLDSGTSLAANTWYHLFVIERTDTGVVDELCSQSATSPALPSNYSKKRRIGSIKTDGSSHIIAFTQNGDEFLWKTAISDVSISNLGTAGATLSISTPLGVKTNALIGVQINGTPNWHVELYSPDQGFGENVIVIGVNPASSQWLAGSGSIRTNTSSQIQAISDQNNTTLFLATNGWIDTRGRFQ